MIILIAFYLALEKKPSERDLDKVSKKVGGRWRSLLIYLEVPEAEIKSLFVEHDANSVEACFFGLISWLQVQSPQLATWATLVEALEEGAAEREFADSIRRTFINITSKQPIGECSSSELMKEVNYSKFYKSLKNF